MKGLVGLSLFANVGIAEAYLKEIGVDIVLANELLPERVDLYRKIYPNTEMICGDITKIEVRDEIVEKAINAKVNMIMATPPCQGMSVAGNRNPFDKRNQLVYYAIDVIKRVKPQFVLLENVPRLLVTKISVDGKLMLIPDYIKKELGEDYQFNTETLVKAKDYGVPQLRERNIFLLTLKSTGIKWEFPPKEEHEITLEEAIGHLPSLDPLLREGEKKTIELFPDYFKKKEEGLKVSKWHFPPTHSYKHVLWMMHTATGKSAIYNREYYPQKEDGEHIVAHHNHYRRLSWNKPCRTITMNNGVISSLCCVHPGRPYIDNKGEILYSDPRVLTIYELMIVTSLPLDWPIPNGTNETLIRHVIGEGIPPLLIKKILQQLLNEINMLED
ncbi:MAG: DNA cytosine methyltransferase [Clostridiales bacterium]|nr:DNA cytosine methyltransferase [Clostridiales bacterium]